MMDFLYFPQDKTEYIPSFIILFVFLIGAFLTFRAFIRSSKKEEQRTNDRFGLHDGKGHTASKESQKEK
ncbi:hypothetical protein [Aureibacillus halotolerans]|uniref:Uncharacterized protein n=1 Tax=Aureibacillus halotolerans TaxID=1508390 RepID=A0A4R6U6T3_9BACI|nr:hypothetical protein [Aureibacillus halotolerans]TDQ40419.1 hypothetical protein EV213_106137 [Aureibacillus halotolerans]